MPDAAPTPSDPRALVPLWAKGWLRLCLWPPQGGAGRVLHLARPFALIGRGLGADLRIDAPEASTRHAYLHLDRRGLFAVDLATRAGTRFRDVPRANAWLQPGDAIEIAGHRIEVLEARTDSPGPGPEPDDLADDRPDLLDEAAEAALARLTLFPHQSPWEPRDVGSELIVLGRSPHCAIRLQGESVARVHAVLVRSAAAVFVVDLSGGHTRINDRPVPRAAVLRDGDVLAMGSAQFETRVRPPESRPDHPVPQPQSPPDTTWRVGQAARSPMEIELARAFPLPPGAPAWGLPDLPAQLPAEAQGAVLAWLVQVVQAGQGEVLRRQGEFQHALTNMVRQICLDNATMLQEHLQRMETINTELAGLRDEIRRRLGPAPPPTPAPPPPPPLRIAPVEPPIDPEQSTSWLLDRVHRLEEENRSTWRDLLGRLGGQNRQAH